MPGVILESIYPCNIPRLCGVWPQAHSGCDVCGNGGGCGGSDRDSAGGGGGGIQEARWSSRQQTIKHRSPAVSDAHDVINQGSCRWLRSKRLPKAAGPLTAALTRRESPAARLTLTHKTRGIVSSTFTIKLLAQR